MTVSISLTITSTTLSSPSASRLTPFAPQGAEPRSGEGSGGALRETTRSETRSGEAGVREGET